MLRLLELELRDGKHSRVVIDRDGTILEYEFEKYDMPNQMYADLIEYELKPPETGPSGAIYIPAMDHIRRFIWRLQDGEMLELPIDLEALGLPGPLLTCKPMLELLELELLDDKKCRVVLNRDGTILEYEFEDCDVPDQMCADLAEYELKPPKTVLRGAPYNPAIESIKRFVRELRMGETVDLPIDLATLPIDLEDLPWPLLTCD